MISSVLLGAMLALPWVACLALRRPGTDSSRRGRRSALFTSGLISLGCLALVFLQEDATLSMGSPSAGAASASTMMELAWTTDRFSLVMVAATMVLLAAATVLLPDDATAAWMLLLMMIGGVLQLWWLQHVWGIVGVTVVISFLALVLPTAGDSPGSAGLARSLWLSITVGDLALIVAIIAGIGGLGEGITRQFNDPDIVREFAAMRPATAMFVGFWWWIGILGRTGQFPLCVALDRVRTYPPLAWVAAVGLGVFTVGWRWCDLGQAWWAASPSVFNLIVSGALASALLCGWFAIGTADFRVRVAYLTAAQIGLALGPLCTGTDVDRTWASAVVMGTVGLAVWCWCMVTAPEGPLERGEEATTGPAWARIMTGGEASTVVWQWSMASRPAAAPVLPTIAPAARSFAPAIVLIWCGLSIAAGSWWWSEEPLTSIVKTSPLSERTGDAVENLAPMRPNGSIPVSAMAVACISAAICIGMRSLLREPGTAQKSVPVWMASATLAMAPVTIIVLFAHPTSHLVAIGAQFSPALACLALAALIIGWVWAGWPIEQQQKTGQSFAVIQRLGEHRLSIPGLLHFGANFPLRGLAQMFRFLDWSVLEVACWGRLRAFPDSARRFHHELWEAGNGSYALVLWVSGTALITTIVWLAHTAR